jgi:hypothetical protein
MDPIKTAEGTGGAPTCFFLTAKKWVSEGLGAQIFSKIAGKWQKWDMYCILS